MSDNPPIFTPFTPEAPPLAPAADKPKAKKERRGRRKAAAAAPVVEAPAPRQKRKPRAIASVRKPRSMMKLPVDTMLAALSGLKGDDGALFEKLLGILNAAGKPQRDRVMAALTKVFA